MWPAEAEISVKVFISYAHDDQDLHKKLVDHLSPLKHSGKITIWQDQEILAGANWEDQINTHLNESDMILLLVSASFIASKYCWNKEVQIALERHKAGTARVIPIILKPIGWRDTPLGQLQALPTKGKPITQWDDQEAALENVVEHIQDIVNTLWSSVLTPTSSARTKEQWVDMGNEHYHAGYYTEALSACKQAIGLDPKDAIVYSNKGLVLYTLKRYEEALSTFEQAIDLDPKLASAYHSKGIAFYALRRYEEALSALEQAIDLDPKLASTYRDKGLTLDRLGRYTEAKQAYEKAWQLGINR